MCHINWRMDDGCTGFTHVGAGIAPAVAADARLEAALEDDDDDEINETLSDYDEVACALNFNSIVFYCIFLCQCVDYFIYCIYKSHYQVFNLKIKLYFTSKNASNLFC